MKIKIKKIFFKENGSVSIYAILIILPIFLLNALLIDTIRIITAERQIETSMEAALRSAMAQFDTDLAGVGLFAYGGEGEASAYSDFRKYLNDQIYNSEDLGGFSNLSNPVITSTSTEFSTDRNLVDLEVFEHQILESVKYQAPVQLGKDFFELIFGGKKADDDEIDKAQELVENYEEIMELMAKRNAEIDEAKKQLDLYMDVINKDIPNKIIGKKVENDDEEIKIPKEIKTFKELLFYLDRYKELTDKEKPSKKEKKEIKNYKKGINMDIYKTVIDTEVYYEDIPKYLIGLTGNLENPSDGTAKYFNDDINDFIGDDDSELLKELKKYTIEDKFFKDILDNLIKTHDKISYDKELGENADITDPGQYTVGQLFGVFYLAIEAKDKVSAEIIIDTIENKLKKIKKDNFEPIEKHLKDYDKIKKALESTEIKKEEDKADQSFASLWADLNKYNNIKNDIIGDNEIYRDLDKIIVEYEGVAGTSEEVEEPGRLQFIKDAFKRFKEFTAFMGDFPDSVMDEVYINEYILANYGTKTPYSLGDSDSYMYNTKKAQYITYGYNVAGLNYFMFIKDIALIMFVGNLISQGLQGGFAGPVGFFKAISTALLTTASDLGDLTSDGKVRWNPFKIFGGRAVNLTMPMMLRLIMAMKSTTETYNDQKLRRLQAVVAKETDNNLGTAPSYIEGNVEGKIKLWFLPQMAEFLPGKVKGSYYYFEKKKVYSY